MNYQYGDPEDANRRDPEPRRPAACDPSGGGRGERQRRDELGDETDYRDNVNSARAPGARAVRGNGRASSPREDAPDTPRDGGVHMSLPIPWGPGAQSPVGLSP